MKIATYLAIAGVVASLLGLEFLLFPSFALAQYAIPTDPHNLMQARYFGGTLLAFGLVPWLARRTRDDLALRAILQASVVGNAACTAISVWAAIAGLQNQMVWGSVAVYLAFLLASIYYLSSPAHRGP
jgi:uncharacterized membrane protein YbaN (DUF454 family)